MEMVKEGAIRCLNIIRNGVKGLIVDLRNESL